MRLVSSSRSQECNMRYRAQDSSVRRRTCLAGRFEHTTANLPTAMYNCHHRTPPASREFVLLSLPCKFYSNS
jgi:hypothetical protein